jgi:hypothetical protein
LIDRLTELSFELKENHHSFSSLQENVEYHLGQDRILKETSIRQSIAEQNRIELEQALKQEEQTFNERKDGIENMITVLKDQLKSATNDLASQVKFEKDVSSAEVNTVRRERRQTLGAIRQGRLVLTDCYQYLC